MITSQLASHFPIALFFPLPFSVPGKQYHSHVYTQVMVAVHIHDQSSCFIGAPQQLPLLMLHVQSAYTGWSLARQSHNNQWNKKSAPEDTACAGHHMLADLHAEQRHCRVPWQRQPVLGKGAAGHVSPNSRRSQCLLPCSALPCPGTVKQQGTTLPSHCMCSH
jgi:hypothetical protein